MIETKGIVHFTIPVSDPDRNVIEVIDWVNPGEF